MTNEEKAREIVKKQVSYLTNLTEYEAILFVATEMAKWKDEQRVQSLIDLNCKLEEQQANYEELKKRYDEAVERERIATKIINELRTRK